MDIPAAAHLMADCAAFARYQKLSGSPEELESMGRIQQQLDVAGYRTTLILHDAYISLPGAAGVEADGAELPANTYSFSRPSPRAASLRPWSISAKAQRPTSPAKACKAPSCSWKPSPTPPSRLAPGRPAPPGSSISARTNTCTRWAFPRSGAAQASRPSPGFPPP